MFTSLFSQLPQQIQVWSTTLATGIGLDPILVFFVWAWGLSYVLMLLILVQIHERLIKKRQKALEEYIFMADSIIYEVQKWIYSNELDSTYSELITNRDSSQKYTSVVGKFEEYAQKISPNLSKSLRLSYQKYSNAQQKENILGYFLVIVTIWAYKLFW